MATLSQGNNNFAFHQFSKDVVKSSEPTDNSCAKDPSTTPQQQQLEPGQDVVASAGAMEQPTAAAGVSEADSSPVIDIVINNVVCSFSVRCHLNLRQIALTASNVEYRRENGMLTMKIRTPYTTASMWSSGKITCTGATSEETAKLAARRYARILQKLGFRVKFMNYRVVNVLGTCTMPFAIKLIPFSQNNRALASYEPELHPGVTYKIKDLKATLKIFSTGSITVTAPSVANVQHAIEQIFPLVYEFRKERGPEDVARMALRAQRNANNRPQPRNHQANAIAAIEEDYDSLEDEEELDEEELMDYPNSDESWD
ncbi:TATA box-binding protein-like 1 [Dermacentor variabilis]|uniref:TATA box-binding protein-like 1 n=1 Tax=Dermacentor variabilis TaxID=34621 RepID=UPI003F5C5BF8